MSCPECEPDYRMSARPAEPPEEVKPKEPRQWKRGFSRALGEPSAPGFFLLGGMGILTGWIYLCVEVVRPAYGPAASGWFGFGVPLLLLFLGLGFRFARNVWRESEPEK